ncbi:MAG: glycoside hydrolase family 97 N-terminal domain-containing protein, partial [Bacteroidales bacterium]
MRFILLLFLSIVLFGSCDREIPEFTSPDKNIVVTFTLDKQGVPWYQIIYKNDTLIEPSRLGVQLENNPMDSALHLIGIQMQYDKVPYNFALDQYHNESDRYNEMVVKVQKNGQEMDIIFRAYDEGIAIRYWLRGYQNVVISGDMTEVHFKADHKCYWAPEHSPHEKNSYYRSPLSEIQQSYKDAHPKEYKYGDYPDSVYLTLPFLVDNGSGKYLNFQQVSGYATKDFVFRLDPTEPVVYSSVMKDRCPEQVVTLPYYSQWLA